MRHMMHQHVSVDIPTRNSSNLNLLNSMLKPQRWDVRGSTPKTRRFFLQKFISQLCFCVDWRCLLQVEASSALFVGVEPCQQRINTIKLFVRIAYLYMMTYKSIACLLDRKRSARMGSGCKFSRPFLINMLLNDCQKVSRQSCCNLMWCSCDGVLYFFAQDTKRAFQL